jgi:Rad3-related DNA helicase
MGSMHSSSGNWIVDNKGPITKFSPIFGAPFVLPNLLGHSQLDTQELLRGNTGRKGVKKVMMMSATLLAPDLMERTLGLPAGSYAYLDLDSPFPVKNRPINYSPTMRMNKESMATAAGRAPMTNKMDKLIDHYLLTGRKCGIIHAVSRRYRDSIIAESRWSSIMTSDPLEHARRSGAGGTSVLVSDNIIDGWDGIDNLCRFVLMPKVPYPNLGDRNVKLRQQKDPRSYDYSAMVSIVQGVGRGVRHETDKAENWILDESWEGLYRRRGTWLPKAFLSAYHHSVSF